MSSKWVVHCKKAPFDVYIGRTWVKYSKEGGRWGNPFFIGRDGDRDEVIEKYRLWLDGKIESPTLKSPPTREQIRQELRGQVLGCWCRPLEGFKGRLMCHGQILAKIANRK